MAGNVKLMTSAGGGVVLDTATTTASDVTVKVPVTGVNNGTLVCSDSSGNVGIGTSSPGYKLDVSGIVNVAPAAISGPQVGVRLYDAGTGSGEGLFIQWESANRVDAAKIVGVGDATGGYLAFYTNAANTGSATERMRIDSSGNLLVGTTGSTSRVHVVGPANSSWTNGIVLIESSGSLDVSYPALQLGKYDNNTTTSQVLVRFTVNNGSAAQGQINANGANAVAFGSWSDERLKENIETLPPQLESICSLRPVEFDYKTGGHQIGFIAQEMKEVYPDVVGEDSEGMLTVTGWSKTEARLVKAIQELKAELNATKAEVAALKEAK